MRPTIVLLAALLAAGCGGSRHARPGAPPGFLLISDAGRQEAARGSFCQQSDSMGLCGDTGPPIPSRTTIVHRGDTIRFELVGATMRGAGGGPSATIESLPCRRKVRFLHLDPRHATWMVDVPRGDYVVDLFSAYEHGDASGTAGLTVSEGKRRIVSPTGRLAGC
jgi:hypothetical protein